jgi:lysozyme
MEDYIQRNSRNKTRDERSKWNVKNGSIWHFWFYGNFINCLFNRSSSDIMKISEEGKALIKKFEGCKLEAYLCSAGVPTIAFGRTKNVKIGDTCTQEQADAWLKEELEEYTSYVNDAVTQPLNQNQIDAMVSWTYNLGPTNLKSSTALKLLNLAEYEGVPAQLKRWNKATVNGEKKVLDGLVRRREAEALMFEGKTWEHI